MICHSILRELLTETSTLTKEAILKENAKNIELRELLNANLNPYRLFQFNKLPKEVVWESVSDKFTDNTNYACFIDLLHRLERRDITGKEAAQAVYDVFRRLDKRVFDLYTKILLKESIGVGSRTVNKAFGYDFIPSFDVMLAPNELANITNTKYPCYVQPKLDGFRCVYLPYNGDITLMARSGLPIANKSLIGHLKALGNVQDHVLDGELYCHSISFNKLSSILRSEDAAIPKDLKFVIYDCVPLKDWHGKKCKLTYEQRLKLARTIINGQIASYSTVIDIGNDKVNSAKEIKDLYKKYLYNGYEGAMIKDIDGLYQWRRVTVKNGAMLKLKPFKTEDVKIIGTYAGEGNFTGLIGGVYIDFNNITVSVGSGFDMATRKKISESPNNYIGKTIEVKYLEVTEEKSMRHPVFVRFREDKDEP